jgi:HAD superfamily hydrolase (TIGR01450 family)
MEILKFTDVVKEFKVVFFDSYGVLRNYKGIFPGIKEMFHYLKDAEIEFYILTNDASRSPEQLAEKFRVNGISEITPQKIISSGMLAREYLSYKVKGGTVVYLGTENSAHYIETIGLNTIPIRELDLENHDDISALVLLDDEGFDWNLDITKTLNLLRQRNIPVIVANTDSTYPVKKHDVAIAIGALADLLEPLARKTFIRFGKPDSQMFSFAYNYAFEDNYVSKKDILMVGDTLKTDIIGGNKFGIKTCLVLSGNTQPQFAELNIASTGIIPDYICESVVK